MSNIRKFDPVLPMLPELLATAMPPQIPQMPWETNPLSDFFHNWKLARLERASESEARISENKTRLVKATLEMMKEVQTYSSTVGMIFRENDHRTKIMEHETKMMETAEQQAQTALIEQQLKNVLLQNEVKLGDLEFKIKSKELGDILDGNK